MVGEHLGRIVGPAQRFDPLGGARHAVRPPDRRAATARRRPHGRGHDETQTRFRWRPTSFVRAAMNSRRSSRWSARSTAHRLWPPTGPTPPSQNTLPRTAACWTTCLSAGARSIKASGDDRLHALGHLARSSRPSSTPAARTPPRTADYHRPARSVPAERPRRRSTGLDEQSMDERASCLHRTARPARVSARCVCRRPSPVDG